MSRRHVSPPADSVLAHCDVTSSVLGAIEEEGHHGERDPAAGEKHTAKQHQLAWYGTNTGTLYQFGQTKYWHRVDAILP